jgi:DNA processing protein
MAQAATSQQAASMRASIRDRIWELLGPAPIAVDELVRVAEASVADVQVALLDLELDGLLERHGGNLVSIVAAKRAAASD